MMISDESRPGTGSAWPACSPQELGIEPRALVEADTYIRKSLPGVYSMLVVRRGALVHERYYRQQKPTDLQDIRSVTKSFTAVLVGIALHQGYFTGLEHRAADLIPEYADLMRPGFRQVTIRDLLRMTSDMAWSADSWLCESPVKAWQLSDDWVRYLLTMPGADHGDAGKFRYCSGDSYLLSVLLTKVTGRTALDFARTELFAPLGIVNAIWPACPDGFTMGHVGLQLTACDLAKLGQLVVDEGTWKGKPLVSPEWVKEMTRPQSEGLASTGRYGYQWWVAEAAGFKLAKAIGAGGQYIVVVPELELVVTVTAKPKGRHWQSALPVIEELLLPSVKK